MSRLKAVNILSCLLPVGMGEEQVGENGIHDVSMRENGAVNGGSSTPNVPADVRGQESGRSDSGVAKGGQGLGDSFFFFLETEKVVCGRELWLCGRMSREVGTKDDKLPPR